MVFDIVFKGKKHTIKEVPVKPKEIEFDKDEVDVLGNKLKKIRNPNANGEKPFIFVDEQGNPVAKHFKAIGGKARKGFSKTDNINEDKIVVSTIIEQLQDMVTNEHTYYLVNSEFKSELKEIGGNCLVFKPYCIRGFKAYKAIIYYDVGLDRVIMKLCRSSLKDADMPETKDAVETEVADNIGTISEDEVVC
jgi:hypothetical protein